MIKKPTGKSGTLKPRLTVDGPRHQWEEVKFPKKKDEIERFIMERFVESLSTSIHRYNRFKANPENHFDFEAKTSNGSVYVDLMEAVYISEPGSPYKSQKHLVHAGDYAAQILSKVIEKSNKYISKGKTPIHLLIYSTHWRFNLNPQLKKLIKFWLMSNKHNFLKIFYIHPRDASSNEVALLYPSNPQEFLGFDPILAANSGYVPADMSNFRRNQDGTITVSMEISELVPKGWIPVIPPFR